MTLGVAIFASVVLVLLVYNKPFRKICAWIAGVAVVIALGWYIYTRYQNSVQEKTAAAHKKLIDDCVKRFSTSGYVDSGPWAKYIDVRSSCENDPDSEWIPEKPNVVAIHGGETLQVVHSKSAPASSIPLVYLGHKQKFILACGVYGEHHVPVEFPAIDKDTKNELSCP